MRRFSPTCRRHVLLWAGGQTRDVVGGGADGSRGARHDVRVQSRRRDRVAGCRRGVAVLERCRHESGPRGACRCAEGRLDGPAGHHVGPAERRLLPGAAAARSRLALRRGPGSAEEGYSGNGTATLARRPAEIVSTAVPFGCARPAAMPAPEHALEVDYALRGAKVVAVRGQFADASGARAFFRGRERNLRDCAGRAGSPAIGRLVGHLQPLGRGALGSDRTPTSDPWREVCVLDGDAVVLVAVRGTGVLGGRDARRLVPLFRSDAR